MSDLNGHEVLRPTKCNPNLGRKDHTINHRITYRLSSAYLILNYYVTFIETPTFKTIKSLY